MTPKLFPRLNLSLETAFNDLFTHVFNATHKQLLQFVLFDGLGDLERLVLSKFALHSLHIDLQVPDHVSVVCLEHLDIALDLASDVLLGHA